MVDGNKYINLVAYKSFEFIEKIKLKLKNSKKIIKNNKKNSKKIVKNKK